MSEVLRDLVVSLSLDGDNFSRNLTSINKQIQEAESEFRRAASGVENFEKSVSGTQSQLSSLQQKLALQQKAVKQYEKALEAANKKLENAYARQGRLTESLDAAKQKNADLRQQVAAATKQYERFARELECGGVFLNGYCASDARVAFGGVKKSGFGRELSHFGLHEFCNAQTVWKDRR